jgi:hypothetical protein
VNAAVAKPDSLSTDASVLSSGAMPQGIVSWRAGGDRIAKDGAFLCKAIEKGRGRTLVAPMPNMVCAQAIDSDENGRPGPLGHTAPWGAQRVSHS